ncbi:uncharacterized protein HKW66_Vig0031380 [Vigna angularis]|uniref:Uncharacterized protein n=1 Tax=Phaseolus angularis TaxID=3914 RepID=A0A8T0L8M7_PHAAN|nr:uncharacterized protein HKW66_Vig0031380 [Vigna angularis]
MYEKGVKYEEVRGEERQGVRMMNLLSSIPTQTTRKPFGTMSALLEAEEDFPHGSSRRILANLLELYAPLNMYLASLSAHTNYALCGLDLHNHDLEVIISKF